MHVLSASRKKAELYTGIAAGIQDRQPTPCQFAERILH